MRRICRYHDYPEFEAFIIEAQREYPSIAQVRDIGRSREGRRLLGLKVMSFLCMCLEKIELSLNRFRSVHPLMILTNRRYGLMAVTMLGNGRLSIWPLISLRRFFDFWFIVSFFLILVLPAVDRLWKWRYCNRLSWAIELFHLSRTQSRRFYFFEDVKAWYCQWIMPAFMSNVLFHFRLDNGGRIARRRIARDGRRLREPVFVVTVLTWTVTGMWLFRRPTTRSTTPVPMNSRVRIHSVSRNHGTLHALKNYRIFQFVLLGRFGTMFFHLRSQEKFMRW